MTRREYLAKLEREGMGVRIPGRGGWRTLNDKETIWLDLCRSWPTIQEWSAWQRRMGRRIMKRMGPDRRWYRGVPPRPWVVCTPSWRLP